MITQLKKELRKHANPRQAEVLQRFFKTGKGEYAEGDKFLGITVPQTRSVIKKYRDLPQSQIQQQLKSKIHEYRLAALFILVWQFEHSDPKDQERIYKFYLRNTKYINNWDLVDSSAHKIVGAYLLDKKDRSILDTLAKSNDLWKQRIAVIANFAFIDQGDFKDALRICKTLLHHEHDLIHKAVGWMLREVGNRDRKTEENFLKKHYKTMPRTALRYAIEKFPETKRQRYLSGTV